VVNNCNHPGYLVKDGNLVCATCGEPSPTTKLVDGIIVAIPQERKCPHCGEGILVHFKGRTVERLEAVITSPPESEQAESKRIVPRGVKKITKRR